MASNRVLRRLGARKPRTGRFPVYFEPAVARTLLSSLLSALRGTQIYRKESDLADRLGKTIGSDCLNIVDDPTILRGLGSRNFDAEGVGCKKLDLVKDGQLESFSAQTMR